VKQSKTKQNKAKQSNTNRNEKLLKAKQSEKRCFDFAVVRSNKFELKKKVYFVGACEMDIVSLHFALRRKNFFL
jgi:hypothetical protein